MGDNEVFQKTLKSWIKMQMFIVQSPNPSAWEISNSERQSKLRQLDICCNKVSTSIETMHYCFDNIKDLIWVHTDKIKFNKTKEGMKINCKEHDRLMILSA